VDGSWKPGSWDEALDLAAETLAHYRDRHDSLSVMHYYY